MPGIDWIPGVSQVKSLAQAVTGDTEGAKRTMVNFARECPGVSQVTSVVQLAAGDTKGALETQKICCGTVSNTLNGIPVIGHAKGLAHHAFGDHEGGNQALNSATRSTVVVASGAAAGIASGGLAAIPAGIAAGVTYDAAATAVSGEEQGYIAAIKNIAENPSAGTIIDAVAIPVGDGLSGYAGGQMAKSTIGKSTQLNKLEALRQAKLEEINAASTTGEALKLGREANAITAEINTIKYGTPQYWDDPKAGTTASKASTSNAAVPASGYVDENKQKKDEISSAASAAAVIAAGVVGTSSENTTLADLDALCHDSYVEEVKGNRQEAQKEMHERDKQKAEGKIDKKYRGVKFTTREKLSEELTSINKDPNRNRKNNNDLYQFLSWSWLFLIMPEEFAYTVVATLNNLNTGLYHSFVRHIDDWAQVIPNDYARVIDRITPLISRIRTLTAANNIFDATDARNELLEARTALSREEYNDLQIAMVEIQMSMHRFIQENLTFANYQGRSLNTNGQERLYFKVQTRNGDEVETKVMVICLSDQRFEPRAEGELPIRVLVTVYFESWAAFTSHGLLETKAEMEGRRNRRQ